MAASDEITQINFTSPVRTININIPSAVLTTQTQNVGGTLEKVTETTTLNLTSTSATGQFSASTTNWISATTLTMSSGTANRNFYYRDSTAGTHTLTVTAQNETWTAATQTIYVAPAPVQFTLTYTAGPNGSITGTLSQIVNQGADGTPVTAVPNAGFLFVNWSDGVLTDSRTDANVTTDITVSANFRNIPPSGGGGSGVLIPGTWTTLDAPGATHTFSQGIDGNDIVGTYYDASGGHGFLYNGTTWTTLDVPGGDETYTSGISGNNIVGTYYDASGGHGFLYNGTTWTTLDAPGANWTQASGISGNNIVGFYGDTQGMFHGFLYDGTVWTTLDAPGANWTQAFGISGNNIVGTYYDASGGHGFLYNGTTWTTFDVPGGDETSASGIFGNNIVGTYYDASGGHGFLYNGTTWTTLDAPGETQTFPSGIFGNNIVGFYHDASGGHGFLYTIPESASTSITLLSPNGGETWNKKGIYSISWKSSGISRVTIQVNCDNVGYSIDHANSGSTGGSYSWLITDFYPISNNCKIMIIDLDGVDEATGATTGAIDESDAPFSIVPAEEAENQPPTISSLSLSQSSASHPNGIPAIGPTGPSIIDSIVIFKGQVDDPDGGQVWLQVELRQLNAPNEQFTGVEDGGMLTSEPVSAGSVATITRPGLVAGIYHWRARAIDDTNNPSDWIEYGTSGDVDFQIGYAPNPNGYDFFNKANTNLVYGSKSSLFLNVFDVSNLSLNKIVKKIDSITFGTGGNCFGMALSSIREFEGYSSFLSTQSKDVLYDLVEPNRTADRKWDANNLGSGKPPDAVLKNIIENQIAQYASTDVYTNVIEILSSNDPKKYILSIQGPVQDSSGNIKLVGHALVPYRMETVTQDQEYKVYVYDSNWKTNSTPDDRFVIFKKINSAWNWEYLLWDGLTWKGTEFDGSATLSPVTQFNYSGSKKLKIGNDIVVKGTASSIIEADGGLRTGITDAARYNEIPDVTMFLPAGAVIDATTSFSEIRFRGSINQNLHLHTIPSLDNGNHVEVFKWEPTGYVKADFYDDNSGSDLYISNDNGTIAVSSFTGHYDLEFMVQNGQDHIFHVSATSTNASSIYTYTVDLAATANDNPRFTLAIDTNGDGVINYSRTINGSTLIDTQSLPTASPVAGTYSSPQSVTLTAPENISSIHYTTNGTTPTCSTGTVYSGPIPVNSSQTINAVSCYETSMSSAVVSFAYVINIPSSSNSGGGGGGGGGSYRSPAKAITGFTIPGQVGTTTINESAKTIALIMPYGANVATLIPTITITGASINPASATSVNFTTPQIYTVTAADGLTQKYTVTVTIAAAPAGQVLGVATFNFTANLRLGAKGDAVTELQKRLTAEGVYSGPITGYFGPLTLAGVKAYQKKYGISQTGTVGPLTRGQLNASQVAGVSTANVEAIRIQIASLQAQVVVLLQQLLQMLQAQGR